MRGMWRLPALLALVALWTAPSASASWEPAKVTHAPPARSAASAAYDSAHGNVVLYGGFGSEEMVGDTWLWDGKAWSEATPAHAPSARMLAAMAYDEARREVVLLGGSAGHDGLVIGPDTWTWD